MTPTTERKDKYQLVTPVTAEEYDEMLKAYRCFASKEETFGDFIVSAIMTYVNDMKVFEEMAEQSEKDALWEASE